MSHRNLIIVWMLFAMMAATAMVVSAGSTQSQPELRLEVYSATWCGPCRRFAPVIERACRAEGVKYHKNVTSGGFPASWKKIGIKSVPTVRFIKDGREVYRCGPCSESSLRSAIRKHK